MGPQGKTLEFEEFATLRVVRQGETIMHQQEIIRCPNKSLLFESAEGVGSTFFLTLPLSESTM